MYLSAGGAGTACGHLESSIIEEREKLMKQTWSWVRDEETSFSSRSGSPAGNLIYSPLLKRESSSTKAK